MSDQMRGEWASQGRDPVVTTAPHLLPTLVGWYSLGHVGCMWFTFRLLEVNNIEKKHFSSYGDFPGVGVGRQGIEEEVGQGMLCLIPAFQCGGWQMYSSSYCWGALGSFWFSSLFDCTLGGCCQPGNSCLSLEFFPKLFWSSPLPFSWFSLNRDPVIWINRSNFNPFFFLLFLFVFLLPLLGNYLSFVF